MKKSAIDFIKAEYDVDSELHSEPQFHLVDVVELMQSYGRYIRNEVLNAAVYTTSLNRVNESDLIKDEIRHCYPEYNIK